MMDTTTAVSEMNPAAAVQQQSKRIILSQWKDQDDGGLLMVCLEYLDVVALIQKVKPVSKQWQQFATQTIGNKCHEEKAFQTNEELRDTVRIYSPYDGQCTPTKIEDLASTYGYPVCKWDVSNIEDFSYVFYNRPNFNEPIGSWDVSNATIMNGMFLHAKSFNQDISSWNVSNVMKMRGMFHNARSFNQDISSWDVSKVETMPAMFCRAGSFNQDISSWDVSNVTNMRGMFYLASSFNQDISSWDVSNVNDFYHMFLYCMLDERDLLDALPCLEIEIEIEQVV